MGLRSAEGSVVAAMHGGRALLQAGQGQFIALELKNPFPLSYGDRVCAAGFPETDLFILRLTKAVARKVAEGRSAADAATVELREDFDMDWVLRERFGLPVRIRGPVVAGGLQNDASGGVLNL